MTRENPRWGHMRVLGELRKLGFHVSLQTVRRYRRDFPRDPSSAWRTFLENHRPEIWASDFFTVHTLWFQTLYVFFYIAHDRRTVMHLNAEWVWRQMINATPWGTRPRYLIRDRDRCYGRDLIARTRGIGIKTVLTPIATPQANAIAERLVGTMRRECLDHMIVVNERTTSATCCATSSATTTRPGRIRHSTSRSRSQTRAPVRLPPGRVVSRPVLAGLTHDYERKAA